MIRESYDSVIRYDSLKPNLFNRKIWFGIGQTESFYESYDSEKDSDRITNPNLANFNDKTESRIRITD